MFFWCACVFSGRVGYSAWSTRQLHSCQFQVVPRAVGCLRLPSVVLFSVTCQFFSRGGSCGWKRGVVVSVKQVSDVEFLNSFCEWTSVISRILSHWEISRGDHSGFAGKSQWILNWFLQSQSRIMLESDACAARTVVFPSFP